MIKPPPNLKQEKFLLSSKKDENFMEGLIDRLQKINIKEKGSISVITKNEQFENSSSSSEEEMQINNYKQWFTYPSLERSKITLKAFEKQSSQLAA